MFEQQHPENDFGRCGRASAGLAFFAALAQLRLNNLQQPVVIQRRRRAASRAPTDL